MTAPRYRDAMVGGCLSAKVQQRADGSVLIEPTEVLQEFQPRLCDYLVYWAARAPDRTLIARRPSGVTAANAEDGQWCRTSYSKMLSNVRTLASELLKRDLSTQRPVAILSGNSIEHLTVALACAWIGVPHAAISPPYSLVSQDFGKLRHVINTLTPGLVFVDHSEPFMKAIAAAVPSDTELLVVTGSADGRPVQRYSEWLSGELNSNEDESVDAAFARVSGATILKFLFTSGSTSLPKAVTTTNNMLCANQQILRQSMKFLATEPPVLVDWLPWNHVFGGSHNVAIALTNGGTLYIDDGNPSPPGMQQTLRNLREISPTIYFNVPKGFEEIARAMQTDSALAQSLLARVRCFFFAGAGLAQVVWDQLDQIAEQTVGERILMITGLGMTETAPTSTLAVRPGLRAGQIGLPCPGVTAKLVPVDGKLEVRFAGPHVMPGYWREPELTAQVFDEEGFYRSGDAVVWAEPEDLQQGLMFDGRLAEDFKLSTGTFVSVGPLRARAITTGAPIVQDVVVTGLNRAEVGMLVFARLDECARLAGMPLDDAQAVCASEPVTQWLQQWLEALYQSGTGSASRVTRALILCAPPSIDLGEVTDKGSINQRAVLKHRSQLVDLLHDADAGDPRTALAIVDILGPGKSGQ